MKPKPRTRTEASAPQATKHLSSGEKQSLDLQADAEHTDGQEREELTRELKTSAESDRPSEP